MTPIEEVSIFEIPEIKDVLKGNLTVFEEGDERWPFPIKRCFFIHDIPGEARRGGHSHKTNYELLICASGEFDIEITDTFATKRFTLSKSNEALLLPPNVWNDMSRFAPGTVLIVLCSERYDTSGYINDFEEFKKWIQLKYAE